MKIAIFDIDDTITFETDFIKRYTPIFLRKIGLKTETINESAEIYGLKEQLINKKMLLQEAGIKAEASVKL